MDKREELVQYIRSKLTEFVSLGKVYDDVKIYKLVDNLCGTNLEIDDIKKMIDSKFSYQLQKITHNDYLSSLKSYYRSSVEKLKKGNNCYLMSYYRGDKILEQALVEDTKRKDNNLPLFKINNDEVAFKKNNNDYELIISDIAYLLGIDYAKTYVMFDENLEANGLLNVGYNSLTEKYLNMEDALQFIKEESTKFVLKEQLVDFHDKHIKKNVGSTIKENIDYVFRLFEALPDIKKANIEKLKKDFLQMKLFDLLVNSVNNDLTNIGIVIDRESNKYSYKLSFMYNNYEFSNNKLMDNEIIFNFMKVQKEGFIDCLMKDYYEYVKEFAYLINNNHKSLVPLIEQIANEHLDYEKSTNFIKMVKENIAKICFCFGLYKKPDSDDNELFLEINDSFENRIYPFIDNYVDESNEKGEIAFLTVAGIVLIGTSLLIGIAIFILSK